MSKESTFEISLKDVVRNSVNPRESAAMLTSHGWGMFEKLEGSDKGAVLALGLSDDVAQMKEYVALMDSYEGDNIPPMASSIIVKGLINALIVRKIDGSTYDLTAGLRRFLGMVYGRCQALIAGKEFEDKVTVRLWQESDKEAATTAIHENLFTKEMNLVEQGKALSHMMKEGKHTAKKLAAILGKSVQTIEDRVKIATSTKLTEDDRALIARGIMTGQQALEKIKGKPGGTERDDDAKGKVKISTGLLDCLYLGKATKDGKFLADYGVEGKDVEVVRSFLAKLMHVKNHGDLETMQKRHKIDAEHEQERAKKIRSAGSARKRRTKAQIAAQGS